MIAFDSIASSWLMPLAAHGCSKSFFIAIAPKDFSRLSGRVSGAFLEMGTPFLLQSVGAVVVGGSSILGGRGNAFGTLLGSIFLVMIVTTMQVLRVAGGSQDIVEGMLIILVLAVATVGTKSAKKEPAPSGQAAKPQAT